MKASVSESTNQGIFPNGADQGLGCQCTNASTEFITIMGGRILSRGWVFALVPRNKERALDTIVRKRFGKLGSIAALKGDLEGLVSSFPFGTFEFLE
jgi:hypothetical protein